MDNLTVDKRSAVMARIRSTGSRPELAVRRLAHRLGYRFRLHRRDLSGTPDLVFPGRVILYKEDTRYPYALESFTK